MNLHLLARHRAQCLAALIEADGWNKSPNPIEREAYSQVRERYRRAEQRWQRATSVLTATELHERGLNP